MSRRLRAVLARAGSDTGNAMVEFCFLGVLLMVPLVYVVLTVFHVQGAAYAAAAATREAGRAFTTAPLGSDPEVRAYQAAGIAMADHGLEVRPGQVEVRCSATPCLTAGAAVTTTIAVQVPLPFVSPLFGDVLPASVRVQARHLDYVDRFRVDG